MALCVAAALGLSTSAYADPPARAARLSYASGAVSFSPAGDTSWLQAPVNRPLVSGDRVWADNGARDELQVGGASVRMDGGSLVTLLNVSDSSTQLQLSQGRIVLRVPRLDPGQVMEVDTPNLAFSIRQPGHYRIDVDPAGNATAVTVGQGQGQAYGEGNTYLIGAGQSYRFGGTDLHSYAASAVGAPDDFDNWSNARDRRYTNSQAVRYVSPDVVGYEDLDNNGSWRTDPQYGPVWQPAHVASDWAPYHDGHWAWVDPWGWTWVDDQPWGFAVSHYGRWAHMDSGWGWVPGPMHERSVYAPALVAFVGGVSLAVALGGGGNGVGWFPLAPREVYRPAYHVSQNYFTNINASNTVINRTQITNVYNNNNVTNITYANRGVRGAVMAVPTQAFVNAQPVRRAAVALTPQMLAHAQVAPNAGVAPQRTSLGEQREGHRPTDALLARPAVVRTAPPPAPASFASRQQALASNGGRPLDEAAMAHLHGAPAQAAPQFNMVHVAQNAPAGRPPAMAAAPSMTPGGRPGAPELAGRPGAIPAPNQHANPQQLQQQQLAHGRPNGELTPPNMAGRPGAVPPLHGPVNAPPALANGQAAARPAEGNRPGVAAPPRQLDQQSIAQREQVARHEDAGHRDQPPHPVAAVTPQPNHAPAQPSQQQQQQHAAPVAQQQAQVAHADQQAQAARAAQQHQVEAKAQEQQHQAKAADQQHQAQAHAQEQHAQQAAHPPQERPQQMAEARAPEHRPQPQAQHPQPHPQGGGEEHKKEEEKH